MHSKNYAHQTLVQVCVRPFGITSSKSILPTDSSFANKIFYGMSVRDWQSFLTDLVAREYTA